MYDSKRVRRWVGRFAVGVTVSGRRAPAGRVETMTSDNCSATVEQTAETFHDAPVVVCGSRGFQPSVLGNDIAIAVVDEVLGELPFSPSEVVSGTANGADRAGELWAGQAGVPVKMCPADWDEHGNKAGYIRNKEMAKYASGCVAIWNGESRGTRMMIELARQHMMSDWVAVYYTPEKEIYSGSAVEEVL